MVARQGLGCRPEGLTQSPHPRLYGAIRASQDPCLLQGRQVRQRNRVFGLGPCHAPPCGGFERSLLPRGPILSRVGIYVGAVLAAPLLCPGDDSLPGLRVRVVVVVGKLPPCRAFLWASHRPSALRLGCNPPRLAAPSAPASMVAVARPRSMPRLLAAMAGALAPTRPVDHALSLWRAWITLNQFRMAASASRARLDPLALESRSKCSRSAWVNSTVIR